MNRWRRRLTGSLCGPSKLSEPETPRRKVLLPAWTLSLGSGLIPRSKDEYVGLIGDVASAVTRPGADGAETRPRRIPASSLIRVNRR